MVRDKEVVQDVESVIALRDVQVCESLARYCDSAGTAAATGSVVFPDDGHDILECRITR